LTYARIFTGETGYRHRREYVVAGPAVNLAARLMAKAEPGQIVLDGSAWSAVQGDFLAEELPSISLKGITEPAQRFLLQGVRKARGLRTSYYPLVGREREQAALETLLDEAVAGRGGALVLVGEAGSGKNRLASHVVDHARRRGMAVLTGRCRPFLQMTPYAPWKDLIEDWLEGDGGATAESRRDRLRDQLVEYDLGSLLPAFASLLGFAPARASSQAPQPVPEQGRDLFAALSRRTEQVQAGEGWGTLLAERVAGPEGTASAQGDGEHTIWQALHTRVSVSHALDSLLERLTQRQPTLVVIADVQWADADSLKLLRAIAKTAHAHPLLVLATAETIADWEDDRIVLSSLSDDETVELAGLALRARRLEPDLATWLLDRANGNPLFIVTYCRALRDAGAVVVDASSDEAHWSGPPPPLPLSLHELLLAQVEQTGKSTQEALRRGATLGVTFPAWLHAKLCEDVLSAGELTQSLDEAARRSLTAPAPPAQTYSFSSPSLHDAIYATLSHAVKQDWHRRAADSLAAADEATRHEQLERIAYHYGLSDDPLKAAHFARLAGDKARARDADEAALAFYAQSLAVLGDDGEKNAGERGLAHEGMGDVHALQGNGLQARESYQAALSVATSPDEPRLKAKLALLSPLLGPAEPGPLEEAQGLLDPSSRLRVWLTAALCWVHAQRGDVDAAARVHQNLSSSVDTEIEAYLRAMRAAAKVQEALPPYADLFALFAPAYLRSAATSSGKRP
jgi:predicted ATPase